jgi:hypothetical protein
VRQVLWNEIKIQGLVILEDAFSPGIGGILAHGPVYSIINEKGFCIGEYGLGMQVIP